MSRVTLRRLQRLHRDGRGVTAVEFAFVAPVLCLALCGALDLGQTLYLQAAMDGIMQKAGRDTGLESATTDVQAKLDKWVKGQAYVLAGKEAKVDLKRESFRTFDDASKRAPEEWTDSNKNGTCDNNEPYVDANNDGSWNADGARAGQGGAKDKTVYTASVTYRKMFPIYNFIGVSPDMTIVSRTVLQNQPFSDQVAKGSTVRNC